MTQVRLLTDIGGWLINIAFIVSALFPLVTALYWPWWDSWWGRNIVGLEVCIGATLLPSVLFRDFGVDIIGLRWVQLVSLAMVVAVVVWRAVMIWHTQRQELDWGLPKGLGEGPGNRPLFFASALLRELAPAVAGRADLHAVPGAHLTQAVACPAWLGGAGAG